MKRIVLFFSILLVVPLNAMLTIKNPVTFLFKRDGVITSCELKEHDEIDASEFFDLEKNFKLNNLLDSCIELFFLNTGSDEHEQQKMTIIEAGLHKHFIDLLDFLKRFGREIGAVDWLFVEQNIDFMKYNIHEIVKVSALKIDRLEDIKWLASKHNEIKKFIYLFFGSWIFRHLKHRIGNAFDKYWLFICSNVDEYERVVSVLNFKNFLAHLQRFLKIDGTFQIEGIKGLLREHQAKMFSPQSPTVGLRESALQSSLPPWERLHAQISPSSDTRIILSAPPVIYPQQTPRPEAFLSSQSSLLSRMGFGSALTSTQFVARPYSLMTLPPVSRPPQEATRAEKRTRDSNEEAGHPEKKQKKTLNKPVSSLECPICNQQFTTKDLHKIIHLGCCTYSFHESCFAKEKFAYCPFGDHRGINIVLKNIYGKRISAFDPREIEKGDYLACSICFNAFSDLSQVRHFKCDCEKGWVCVGCLQDLYHEPRKKDESKKAKCPQCNNSCHVLDIYGTNIFKKE